MKKKLLTLSISSAIGFMILGVASCNATTKPVENEPSSTEEIINPKEDYVTGESVKKLNSLGEKGKYNYETFRSDAYQNGLKKFNSFSSKLSSEIISSYEKTDENIAVSPLSLFLASSMEAEVTAGKTREELLGLIGLNIEESRAFNKNLYDFSNFITYSENYNGEKLELEAMLELNNSIWMALDLDPKEACLNNLSQYYYCEAYEADFENQIDEVNKAVTEYVKAKTRGLIDKDFEMSSETMCAVINTLYLKDIWGSFDLQYTKDSYKFINADGTTVENNLLSGNYFNGKKYENKLYSSFFTATKNGFKLTFIKPNEGVKLGEVFTESTIKEACDGFKYVTRDEDKKERYETRCFFPEFEAGFDGEVQGEFKKLGIGELFNPFGANFSSITDKQLYCDRVIHGTKFKVDKVGIEGAAVTIFDNKAGSAYDEFKVIYDDFVLDRDFGFVLSYRDSPVFVGKVNKI